jgi:aldose 1-epimerase
MPNNRLIHLAAGPLHLEIAPAAGGSIARFYSSKDHGGRTGHVDWLRPASDQALARRDPLAMGSFPLLPFCNRIRQGRASFEGREIRFPPNHPSVDAPHPLHGIGWQRPWTVVEANAGDASVSLEVEATEAWPWRFSATQHMALNEQRLEVSMTLTNEDAAPMPAGIGHHPYFPHTPGTRLKTATASMWQADAQVMPTRLEVTQAVGQLRAGVLVSELDLDNNFVGWEHDALIEWAADDLGPPRSLEMHADAPLDYFVLYSPRGADHFCAEPVSQCTDWLNLLPRHGREAVGGCRLAPGETLRAAFTLTPHWN